MKIKLKRDLAYVPKYSYQEYKKHLNTNRSQSYIRWLSKDDIYEVVEVKRSDFTDHVYAHKPVSYRIKEPHFAAGSLWISADEVEEVS